MVLLIESAMPGTATTGFNPGSHTLQTSARGFSAHRLASKGQPSKTWVQATKTADFSKKNCGVTRQDVDLHKKDWDPTDQNREFSEKIGMQPPKMWGVTKTQEKWHQQNATERRRTT